MTHLPASEDRAGRSGIGAALRSARTERGLSIADLQTRTKISARHLAALEDERFGDLPPLPFTRGFLRVVAQELDLEADPLIRRLEGAMAPSGGQADGLRRLDGALVPAVPPSRVRRLVATAITLGGLAALALGIYLVQQFREFSQPAAPAPPPQAAPAPTPAALATEPSGPGPSPVPTAPGPARPRAGPPPAAGGVTLDLEATGRSWLRVVADGRTVFEGFVEPGQALRWPAGESIAIRVGNAGAVRLFVNGVPEGPLGRPGEVVDRAFRRDGRP